MREAGSTRFIPRLIDAHCHLADRRLRDRIDDVLRLSSERQIDAFIQGGVSPADWDRQRELASRYPGRIFCCFGIHPWFAAGRMGVKGSELEMQVERALEILPEYLKRQGVAENQAVAEHPAIGVGELGIDLGPKTDPATEAYQLEIFEAQLRIAKQAKLPLVLHVVKAHSQAIETLAKHGPWPQGGLVHAFSGSLEIGREYQELGFTLSIGGVVARKGYETLKRALKKLDLARIVLESDSPDQIPDGFQGIEDGVNDPRSLWTVAAVISDLRREEGLTAESLLQMSRRNLIRIFGLSLRA